MAVPEFITDEYIDRLPSDATMGFVFADLYVRGNLLADNLERRVLEADSGLSVPDTALEISEASRVLGDDIEDSGVPYEKETARYSKYISARASSWPRYLFRVTQEGLVGEGLFPKPSDSPVSISGFRDRLIPLGDYYLDKQDERIICTVGHIIDPPPDEEPDDIYDHEQPYTGDSDHDASTEVASLDPYEKKRLRIVTNAIDLGIARARLLRDGADFHEVFGLEGPRQSSPPKRFSLRSIFAR